MVASHAPATGELARNPGVCPDWESNRGPFGSQASNQSTEPHQPGTPTSFLLVALSEYQEALIFKISALLISLTYKTLRYLKHIS